MVAPDYYQLMGAEPGWINPTEIDEVISKRRSCLSKAPPPDRAIAQKLAVLLTRAKSVLTDSNSRQEYDSKLKETRLADARHYVDKMIVGGKLPTAATKAIINLMEEFGIAETEIQSEIEKHLKKRDIVAGDAEESPEATEKALEQLRSIAATRAQLRMLGGPPPVESAAPAPEPAVADASGEEEHFDIGSEAPVELKDVAGAGSPKVDEPVDIGKIEDSPVSEADQELDDIDKLADDLASEPEEAGVDINVVQLDSEPVDVGTLESIPETPDDENIGQGPVKRRSGMETSKRTKARPRPGAAGLVGDVVQGKTARRWTRAFAAAFFIAAAFVAGDLVDAFVPNHGTEVEEQTASLRSQLTSRMGVTGAVGVGIGIGLVIYLLVVWFGRFKPKFLVVLPTLVLMAAAYGAGAVPVGEERPGEDQTEVIKDLEKKIKKTEKSLVKAVEDAKPAQEEIVGLNEKIVKLEEQAVTSEKEVAQSKEQAKKAVEEVADRDRQLAMATKKIQKLEADSGKLKGLQVRIDKQKNDLTALGKDNIKKLEQIARLEKQVADLKLILSSKN